MFVMRLHRFITSLDLKLGQTRVDDRLLAHQLQRVLRLKVGDEIVLCDGAGREAVGEILSLNDRSLEVNLGEARILKNEPKIKVILYVAMLKQEHFNWALQKAVECGASKIIPLKTARTVKTRLNLERARNIVREAAEQSGRGIAPDLVEPMTLVEAFKKSTENDFNFFFAPGAPDFFSRRPEFSAGARVGVFIGPEGGWDPEEFAEAARLPHLDVVGLGPLVLRAETASVMATFLVANLLF